MSQSSLPTEILKLTIPQRIHLAEQIWESVAETEESFELTAAQKSELDSRLDVHAADPERGILWQELKKKLLED